MDAPPIPRLVDLVHVFKGVVVEQFKKRLEKLLSDSILLWRLLKLLFKILQWRSWVGSSLFWFPLLSFYSKLFVSPVILRSIILWFFSPMESDQDDTPQQQEEEGDADTGGKKECPRKSDSLFPLSDSSKKAQRREAQCKLYELQCELEKLKLEAEDDSEESDVAENSCRSKSRAVHQECPIKPEKFPEKSLAEKDQDLGDQFLDGLFDFRLQQKLYEDETNRNFCEVLYRAQELELIQKNSEERRGPLLSLFRDVRSTDEG